MRKFLGGIALVSLFAMFSPAGPAVLFPLAGEVPPKAAVGG